MSQVIDMSQTSGYGVTKQFKVVDTAEVVSRFEAEGYQVESVLKANVRNQDKNGFQKHLIRMSHPEITCKVNGLRPEIIYKNAYDGTTQNEIFMGIYRFICANGLESGTDFERIKVKHVGDNVFGRVLDACLKMRQSFPELIDTVQRMQSRQLSQNEIVHLAQSMGEFLVSKRDNIVQADFSGLLRMRRSGDSSADLFTILNVIQENSLAGSYRYVSEVAQKDAPDAPKRLTTRRGTRVKALDRTSQINTKIWDLASQFVA
jgi:hypothetical protein